MKDKLIEIIKEEYDSIKSKVASARNYIPSFKSLTIPLAFLGVLSASEVEAKTLFNVTQLTTHPTDQINARVDQGNIAYQTNELGNWDIKLRLDTGEYRFATTNSSSQEYPAIFWPWTVWDDKRNYSTNGFDVYGYNGDTDQEVSISIPPQSQGTCAIHGLNVVYDDCCRTGGLDIYMKVIGGSEKAITTDNPQLPCPYEIAQYFPDIFYPLVVYEGLDECNFWKAIFKFDLSSKQENIISRLNWDATNSGSPPRNSSVGTGKIIWEDYRDNLSGIFDIDIWAQFDGESSPRKITDRPGDQTNARLSNNGKLIVYQSNETGDNNIHIFDVDQEKHYQITNNLFEQINPDVDDLGNIVWQSNEDGDWNIFTTNYYNDKYTLDLSMLVNLAIGASLLGLSYKKLNNSILIVFLKKLEEELETTKKSRYNQLKGISK